MIDLIAEAARLDRFFEARGWRYCFIGGLAVQQWGEPRLTRDLDVSLLVGFGSEAGYVDSLLGEYAPRIQSARDFALARRVLLLQSGGGIGIDISLAAIPYEELVIGRAAPVEMLPGSTVRLCSPEDLIIMKMFAGRPTDLRDVRSVIVRQQARGLDWPYIESNLAELAEAKDDLSLVAKLRRIRESMERGELS
jgi:hypothetical protein